MSKEQYDSLTKRIEELEQQRIILNEQLSDAKTKLAKLLCPFEIGEEIQLQSAYKGLKRAVIKDIASQKDPFSKKQGYTLHVTLLKKNGEPSSLEITDRAIFDCYAREYISWDEFARLHGKEPISFDE